MTDSVPNSWCQVDFGSSALCGKLCAIEGYLDHLRYRIEEYDHADKMLLVYGPVPPHNCDELGEIDADRFWIHRDEAVVEESPSNPVLYVVD